MADDLKSPEQKPPQEQQFTVRDLFEFHRQDAQWVADHFLSVAQAANKTAIESATFAFRMAILINGGAAVALLAFVGGMIGQGKVAVGPQLNTLAFTLIWFASGVAIGTLAAGLDYVANLAIVKTAITKTFSPVRPFILDSPSSKRWKRVAAAFGWTAGILGLGSIAFFAYGMIQVYFAIIKLATP
jgi:hypothetical protein